MSPSSVANKLPKGGKVGLLARQVSYSRDENPRSTTSLDPTTAKHGTAKVSLIIVDNPDPRWLWRRRLVDYVDTSRCSGDAIPTPTLPIVNSQKNFS